jgi:hypothetical protein
MAHFWNPAFKAKRYSHVAIWRQPPASHAPDPETPLHWLKFDGLKHFEHPEEI